MALDYQCFGLAQLLSFMWPQSSSFGLAFEHFFHDKHLLDFPLKPANVNGGMPMWMLSISERIQEPNPSLTWFSFVRQPSLCFSYFQSSFHVCNYCNIFISISCSLIYVFICNPNSSRNPSCTWNLLVPDQHLQ